MTLNRLAIVLITATLVTLSGQLAPVAAQKGPAAVGALKIPELGTATTPIHGFEFSATAVVDLGPTGGGGAGKTTFNQVGITRTFDAVSIELFKRIATGRRLPRVEILLYKPGTTTVETTYGLNDVVITLFRGSPGSEAVGFAYAGIDITGAGSSFCFDIVSNTGC
jgi:hypothetical protein